MKKCKHKFEQKIIIAENGIGIKCEWLIFKCKYCKIETEGLVLQSKEFIKNQNKLFDKLGEIENDKNKD